MDALPENTSVGEGFEAPGLRALAVELSRRAGTASRGDARPFMRECALIRLWRDPQARQRATAAVPWIAPLWPILDGWQRAGLDPDAVLRQATIAAVAECLRQDAARPLNGRLAEAARLDAQIRGLEVRLRRVRFADLHRARFAGRSGARERAEIATLNEALRDQIAGARAHGGPADAEMRADFLAIRTASFCRGLFGFRPFGIVASLVSGATGVPMSERRVRHLMA